MSGKSLPFDIRDWQEIVVEGINVLNDNNWFPVCTFIVGLPNETEDDMRQSLDLLHRLKNNKILYVPSIFTPLEDTRMASGSALKAKQLTKLQWEFIMTAWKQSREFGEMRDRSRTFFSVGTKDLLPRPRPLGARQAVQVAGDALCRRLGGEAAASPLSQLGQAEHRPAAKAAADRQAPQGFARGAGA